MKYFNIIQDKLNQKLNPISLDIIDESFLHKGHLHAHKDGESHFRIKIISNEFHNMSKVQRHRVVYNILKDELAEHVHALAIEALTPEEESK